MGQPGKVLEVSKPWSTKDANAPPPGGMIQHNPSTKPHLSPTYARGGGGWGNTLTPA